MSHCTFLNQFHQFWVIFASKHWPISTLKFWWSIYQNPISCAEVMDKKVILYCFSRKHFVQCDMKNVFASHSRDFWETFERLLRDFWETETKEWHGQHSQFLRCFSSVRLYNACYTDRAHYELVPSPVLPPSLVHSFTGPGFRHRWWVCCPAAMYLGSTTGCGGSDWPVRIFLRHEQKPHNPSVFFFENRSAWAP